MVCMGALRELSPKFPFLWVFNDMETMGQAHVIFLNIIPLHMCVVYPPSPGCCIKSWGFGSRWPALHDVTFGLVFKGRIMLFAGRRAVREAGMPSDISHDQKDRYFMFLSYAKSILKKYKDCLGRGRGSRGVEGREENRNRYVGMNKSSLCRYENFIMKSITYT